MRKLQITLFIIGLIFLSTQTFRHIYVKWIEDYTSVLDKYNEKVEKEIKKSQNIEDLIKLYDKAFNKVKKYEQDPKNPKIKERDKRDTEPYKTMMKIRGSIYDYENHKSQIDKLRFYWFCGFLSVLIGCFVYIKFDQWIGIVGMITGFSEMIFWTCPTFIGIFGSKFEFEKLINNKLFFSIVTWILLICLWLVMYKVKGKIRKEIV